MNMIPAFSSLKKRWIRYWFAPVAPIGFAMFRIAFGLILLLYHMPRLWHIGALYTKAGYLFPIHLFFVLHLPLPSFVAALILNIVLLAAIASFILGYKTKCCAVIIFALHAYFSLLERFSTKGYGQIMIIYALLLIWSPSGEFLSIDAVIKRFRRIMKGGLLRERIAHTRVPVTMQRIMLVQLVQIYSFNVLSKFFTGGWNWFNGQNVLSIYRDTAGFARPFVIPILNAFRPLPILLGILIPGMLLFIACQLLRRDDRPYAIICGVIYHGFALVTTTVPYVFTFLMFSLYVIAIEPDVWERWWSRLTRYYEKKHATLFYDDTCALCRRTTAFIRAADELERIRYVSISSITASSVMIGGREVDRDALLREMHMESPEGALVKGFGAYRAISRMIPLFWAILPFLYIPGVPFLGKKIYGFIAKSRKNVCVSCT